MSECMTKDDGAGAGEGGDPVSLAAQHEQMLFALRAMLFQVIQGPVLDRDACVTQAKAAYRAAGGPRRWPDE